jgi:hypothetical protein
MPGIFRFKFAIEDRNNAALTALKAMPQKDSTSDGTDNFAITRNEYVKSGVSVTPDPLVKKWYGNSSSRDASTFTRTREIQEIGVGTLNATQTLFSFTSSSEKNTVNDALRRVRAGGSVAPAKKIYAKPLGQTPHFPVGPLLRPACKIVNSTVKYNGTTRNVQSECRPVQAIHPKAAMAFKPISQSVPVRFH